MATVTQPEQAPIRLRMLFGYFPQNPENYPQLDQVRPKVSAGEEIELPFAEAKTLLRTKKAERVEDVE